MKIIALSGFLMAFILVGCANQSVKPETLVIKEVVYAAHAAIPEAIRAECDLPNKLSTFIKTDAQNQYSRIINDPATANNQDTILNIEITHVEGLDGGAWTGPKSVAIKATLIKQGKVIGDFKASRISNSSSLVGGILTLGVSGIAAGLEGTCGVLRHCIRTLSRDVTKWLESPTPNAVLK
ncbi:MAG: hypothetical protein ABL903_07185 [Methylococcales bacterium]